MEPCIPAAIGGILGLVQFLTDEDNYLALAYDLMVLGRSIHAAGSPHLSWVEVKAAITHRRSDSALSCALSPISEFSTPQNVLLMGVVDLLAGANWQRGGGRGGRPKPVRDQLTAQLAKPVPHDEDMTSGKLSAIRDELASRRRELRSG